MIKILFQKI